MARLSKPPTLSGIDLKTTSPKGRHPEENTMKTKKMTRAQKVASGTKKPAQSDYELRQARKSQHQSQDA